MFISRCLDHSSVAAFMGMTRAESQAAFIFLEELTTARSHLQLSVQDVRCRHRFAHLVPKLLEQIVEGLEHIHKDGLVHMELSTDTVMVSQKGSNHYGG